jgi:hypothetical protein
MNKDNFLMYANFEKPLSHAEFITAKEKYFEYLELHKPEIKSAETIFELIENVKRSPVEIGPYQKISVFEALNRIGSDLVLLDGTEKLFTKEDLEINKPSKVLLRMSTIKGYDFEVYFKDQRPIYGEAFNASPSFCNTKMRQAIDKFIKDGKEAGIVFVNEEVSDTINKYLKNNNRLKGNPSFKLYPIFCKTSSTKFSGELING